MYTRYVCITTTRYGDEGHTPAPTLGSEEMAKATHARRHSRVTKMSHKHTPTHEDRQSRVDQPTGWAPSGAHAAGSLVASERCLRPTCDDAVGDVHGVRVDRRHADRREVVREVAPRVCTLVRTTETTADIPQGSRFGAEQSCASVVVECSTLTLTILTPIRSGRPHPPSSPATSSSTSAR
jgi:hypothetical protein